MGRTVGELYSLHPSKFTAARDAMAQELRRSGHRELADEVKRLHRPSVSAWMANLLSRTEPDQVDNLVKLGDRLRAAQAILSAAGLRELSVERRRLVAALAKRANELAGHEGYDPGGPALRELEGTLEAAVADELVGAALARGCLTIALHYSGLGPDGPENVGTEEVGRRGALGGGGGAETGLAGQERVVQAEAAAIRARQELSRGQAELEEHRAHQEQLHLQRAALEDQLEHVRGQYDEACEAVRAARERYAAGEAGVAKAEAALARAHEAASADAHRRGLG